MIMIWMWKIEQTLTGQKTSPIWFQMKIMKWAIFIWNHETELIHSWQKRLLHPHWRQWNQCGSNFCVSIWLKLAWYGPVIVPQRNPTLPWADIQCKVKWDRRAPKPQYRWSFPQINLHTVTTLNQYLLIFFKVFSDCLNNAPSNPYGYKAWGVCTCPWGH